jgi:hypothetical protein
MKTTLSDEESGHFERMFNTGSRHSTTFLANRPLMLTPDYLPVIGLPRIVWETSIGDQSVFSIRGTDEALFRAYYASFLKTWGDYMIIRDEPFLLGDGSWVVIGWATRQVTDAWHRYH